MQIPYRPAKRMASVLHRASLIRWRKPAASRIFSLAFTKYYSEHRELNMHAMRMGPGKHLKGLTLMGGIVAPEEVCFVPDDPIMNVNLLHPCFASTTISTS